MTQISPFTFTRPVTADGLRAALDEHGLMEQRVLVPNKSPTKECCYSETT
jgi:hypothetical protein